MRRPPFVPTFPTPRALTSALWASAFGLLAAAAPAQCGLVWQEGSPAAGPDGSAFAVLPLPNGDVVAGGAFRNAGGTIAANIARWDGATWQGLGSGTDGNVRCLARMQNGDVVAGGTFTSAGGVACNRVARWNGSVWAPLGAGLSGTVQALRVLANGTLAAAGSFVLGGTSDCVAVWNGTTWSSMGSGTGPGEALALMELANGDLVAGGAFSGGAFTVGLQRWNGTTWSAIAGFDPTFDASVGDLARRGNGDLVITGSFRISGLNRDFATWNGTSMQPETPPVPANLARRLLALANGDVLLGGSVSLLNQVSLARWNGATWQPVQGAPTSIASLAEDAAGRFVVGTTVPSTFPRPSSVFRFDGVTWQPLGGPVPPSVRVMVDLPDGSVVAGGQFAQIGGVVASNIARWAGGSWSALGAGVNGRVAALAVAANGDVWAGGLFTLAGGAPAVGIARWDGQAWLPVGAGLPPSTPNDVPTAIGLAGNGDVLVAMYFGGVHRFDGATWSNLVLPGSIASGHAMVTRSNGDVILGGSFNGFGLMVVGVLVYSNGAVAPSPGAPPFVTSMLRTADDAVIVTGQGVQRWDGATWSQLPSAYVYDFAQLPGGDLVAVGNPAALGGGPTSCLYRLRANAWQTIGDVTGGAAGGVVVTRRGDLWISGSFQDAGGIVAEGLAHAVPACPATTVVSGLGCAGSAGPVALLPENDAWLGSTFRALASGMTTNSLALQLFGTSPVTLPLPFGAPGCSLWVAPLLSDVLVPAGGQATSTLVIPDQMSLAGQQFHAQVLGLEFAGAGLSQVTGTNALLVTIGAL